MCNEIEERKVTTYIATLTDVDTDPVEVSIYPDTDLNAIEYGSFPRAELERAGIDLSHNYETFVVECWQSPYGRTHLEMRPHIHRDLTPEEYAAIQAEIDAVLPEGIEDDY